MSVYLANLVKLASLQVLLTKNLLLQNDWVCLLGMTAQDMDPFPLKSECICAVSII